MILLGILKFIVSFVAIASTLMFIMSVISSIINPQLVTTEDGQVKEKNANFRAWMGLITAIFWSILIVI